MQHRVLIVVPTCSQIHAITAMTCHRLASKGSVEFIAVMGRPVDYVRNTIMRLWRDKYQSFTHLLTIDSDTVPPLDVVERLINLDTTVATGCYPIMYHDGPRWALSNRTANEDRGRHKLLNEFPVADQPFEVEGCGAGCLLLRRDIFDKVDWPWFRWVEHEDGLLIGEDFYFCDKVRAAGLPIIADPGVICQHHKTVELTSLAMSLSGDQ